MTTLASLTEIIAPASGLAPAAVKSAAAKLAGAGLLSDDGTMTFLDAATMLVALAGSASPSEVVAVARACLTAPLTMAVYTSGDKVTHLDINDRIASTVRANPITALAEEMAKIATHSEAAPKSLRFDLHRSSHQPTGTLFVMFEAGTLQLQYGVPSVLEADSFVPAIIVPTAVIADVTALFESIPLIPDALQPASATLH